jgi:hypothetical protein
MEEHDANRGEEPDAGQRVDFCSRGTVIRHRFADPLNRVNMRDHSRAL